MAAGIDEVADRLGLEVLGSFAGGEFGATRVRDGDGRELVLKTFDSPTLEEGLDLVPRRVAGLRTAGYPAPEIDVGAIEGRPYSVQTVLPGAIPDVVTPDLAAQLVTLAEQHAERGVGTSDWRAEGVPRAVGRADGLSRHADPRIAAAGRELGAAVRASADAVGEVIRFGDAMHCDFHHRNYLAVDGAVSGVFDWEGSRDGDWRLDLVSLAMWGSAGNDQFEPAASDLVRGETERLVPPVLRALFGASRAIAALTFYASMEHAALEWFLRRIDAARHLWTG